MATLTLAFKGKTLQVYPLQDGVLTIGRDPGCDIHIDSLAVEPQHARLMIQGDKFILTQTKHSNATHLNHKPIEEAHLENNDIIRIGKHVLMFNLDETLVEKSKPASNIAKPTYSQQSSTVTSISKEHIDTDPLNHGWLQVMNGKMLGKTFKLRSGLTDLGKLGMLPALIALRSSGYFISNLADSDTLSVANQTIGDKSHPLHDGDLIKLGKVTLQFHLQA